MKTDTPKATMEVYNWIMDPLTDREDIAVFFTDYFNSDIMEEVHDQLIDDMLLPEK